MKRLFVLFCALLSGCGFEPYVASPETEEKVIRPEEYEYMLCFLTDTDPRFVERQWGEPAFRFLTNTVSNYFRDRSTPTDRVLLARLDEKDPFLWQGTPKALTREFGNAKSLQAFLKKNSASGNRCFASLATTLEYLNGIAPIREGKAKAVVIVLSSFKDESETKDDDMAKASEELKRFKNGRNEIGFWWIDHHAVNDVQKCFRDAGLREPQHKVMEKEPEPLRFNQ